MSDHATLTETSRSAGEFMAVRTSPTTTGQHAADTTIRLALRHRGGHATVDSAVLLTVPWAAVRPAGEEAWGPAGDPPPIRFVGQVPQRVGHALELAALDRGLCPDHPTMGRSSGSS